MENMLRQCTIRVQQIRYGSKNTLPGIMLLLVLMLLTLGASAQINMMEGSVTSCSDYFYDSRGAGGDYLTEEDVTLTIYPATPGSPLKVDFTSFETEEGWDFLYIYDGNSTGAPLIGAWSGSSGPGTVTSTAADGSLTFHFTSDISVTASGWEAEISCVHSCSGIPEAGSAIASLTTACPETPVRFSLRGATGATGITHQWDTSATGSPGTFFPIAGATASKLFFTPPQGRTLYYQCRISCPASAAADTSTAVAVSVTTPHTVPYLETFESASPGSNILCAAATSWAEWDKYFDVMSGSYSTWGYTDLVNHTPGGNQYLWAGYGLTVYSGIRDFWYTPGINLEAGSTYAFSFWYLTDGTPWQNFELGAYIGNAQSEAAMNPLVPDFVPTNTVYEQLKVNYTPTVSGTYFFGIHVKGNESYGMAIDDIAVNKLLPCSGKPPGGSMASVSPAILCEPGRVTLSLSSTPEFGGLSYEWWECDAGGTLLRAISAPSSSPTFKTGLISAATYFRCIIKCTLGSTADTAYSHVVQLLAAPLSPPYLETFESSRAGINVPCAASSYWSGGEGFNTKATPVITWGYTDLVNHTPGGSKYLLGGYGLTVYSGAKDFWFTPGIALHAGHSYEFSFWYLPDGTTWDPLELGAYAGTDQSAAAMVPLAPDFVPDNTTYQRFSAVYAPPAGGTYYFGIYVRGNYSFGLSLDDIGVNELPPCSGKPSGGGVANISTTMLCSPGSVTLWLSSFPKVSGLTFQWWECDASGALIAPLSAPAFASSFTTGTITSKKYFRCVMHCTAGSATDTAHSGIVRLDVSAIDPPYIETFETGKTGINMPCAAYTFDFGNTWSWNLQTSPVSSWSAASLDNHTPGGKKYLLAGSGLGYWSDSPYEYWFTPAIRFTAGKRYQLSFWYQTDGERTCNYSIGAFMGAGQAEADMTTTLIPTFTTKNKAYKQAKVQFTATASGQFYIGIQKSQDDDGNGAAIDDIGLQEVPPCSGPVTAGVIVSEPSMLCAAGASAILDLSGSTLATGLSYQWLYATSPSGPFIPTGDTTLPYTTTPLYATTWFKAIVTCTVSGTSDTSDAIRINVSARDIPYAEDFETTPSGEVPLCSDATLWGDFYYDGWYVADNGIIGGPYKNTTPGGKQFLIGGYYLGSPESVSEDNYWFTPGLNLKAAYLYKLSFNYLAVAYEGDKAWMGVYLGKSQSVAGMTIPVVAYRTITNNTFERKDTLVSVPADGVYYLGFRKSGDDPAGTYTSEGVAFDDINLNYADCNGMPAAGMIKGKQPSGTAYCSGTELALTDIGATISMVPGISYQWQRKPLATATAVWSSISGATDTVLIADTLVGYAYRMLVVCRNTNDTAYTPSFLIPQITPAPPVAITPSASPAEFCIGDTVKFAATDYPGAVYDWMLDGVIVPGWKFSDMGATEPGTYMVRVTSPASPCPAYSNQVRLIANDPGYTVTLTDPADSIVCAGTTVTLSGSASKAGVSYEWRKNNVAIPGATASTLTVSSSGHYRLMASDGSASCAAASRTIEIKVKPGITAVLKAPLGTTACAEDGVTLHANDSAYSYEWQRGGSTVSSWADSVQVIRESGTYRVKVRTADGCVGLSPAVAVTILPAPDPVISRSGYVLSTGVYPSYQWMRNGVDIPGAKGPSYTLSKTGLYKVRVTGTNDCEGVSDPVEASDPYLGLDESTQTGQQIRIYPNPTASVVFIESPVRVQAELKDVAGKTVLRLKDATQIDLGNYADGVYLLVLKDKDRVLVQQRVMKITR